MIFATAFRTILILCTCAILTSANAQGTLTNEGTDFWFAYTEMYDTDSANYNVHITSKTGTSGLITIPGTAFSFPYSVISGTVTTVPLPGADVWNSTNGVATANKVVHVTSVAPVTVFASAEHQHRNEASMVLPTQVLGSKYCISTLPTDATSWSYDGQFTIVAAGAPCTVKITPTQTVIDPTLICTAAVPYNVTLNIGECYQLQTATSGQNLAGTIVEALNGTDVFAVYSGHDCALIGATAAYDPLYEVEFPTYSWGKEYIITPVEECSYSKIHVGTVTDSNAIYVDGVLVDTINIGEFYESNVSAATVVTSTYPIDVKQLMPSAGATGSPTTGPGDPSMGGIVPNNLMFLDTITFPHLAGNIVSHYISVVTRVNDTNTVFHNLGLLSGWTVLPQLTEYAYISVSTSAGSHSVTTTGCGFLAYAYGLGDRESYHYAAGVNFLAANDSVLTSNLTTGGSTFCNNDDILFSTSAGSGLNAYYWDFGDGDSSNLAIPTHSFDIGGTYNISCILDYGCIIDTIYDTLIIDECFNVMNDTAQCSGASVLLYAWGSGTGYTWVDSSNFSTIIGTTQSLTVSPTTTTTYAVFNSSDTAYTTVTIINCFTCVDNLVPNPSFESVLSLPNTSCCTQFLTKVFNWSNAGGTGAATPDYFNQNANTLPPDSYDLPDNYFGSINPHSGDVIVGIVLFHTGASDFREYIDVHLSSPLIPGETYNLSFWATNGVCNGNVAGMSSNNIGVHFSIGALNQTVATPFGFAPTFNDPTQFYNAGWQQYSYQYTPSVAVDHITVGNFFNDAATTNIVVEPATTQFAYLYLDDFCITAESTLSISDNDTICENDSVQLWAAGPGPYSWIENGNFATILGTNDTIVISPASTTTYSVFNSTDTVSATVTVLPVDTTYSNLSICPGDSTFIQGAFQSTPGTYYDIYSNVLGCDSVIETTLNFSIPDTIGFTYIYTDPCDSTIVEFTANSTGQMDSIWWSMGFPGGSGLVDTITTVNFPNAQTYNINLWIYGACGWTDTTQQITTPSLPAYNYELMNHNKNYCSGDPVDTLFVVDTSGNGGIINWYDDAALMNNVGTGLYLIPQSSIGVYTYYITETLPCGERTLDSVNIEIINCVGCFGNLIPNPGFETYSTCYGSSIAGGFVTGPGNHMLHLATPWSNPAPAPDTANADYLNTCAEVLTDVPHTGNGYAGLVIFSQDCEYREYLQAPLNQSLLSGRCYQASMHIQVYTSSSANIDSVGMYFSAGAPVQGDPICPTGFGVPGQGLINVNPQITNDPTVDMTAYDWQFVTGTFIATGGEDYITIGNFAPDLNLNPQYFGPFPNRLAYYLVDDVCLYEIPPDTIDVNVTDTISCSPVTLTGSAGYDLYYWYDSTNVLVSDTLLLNVNVQGTNTYVLYSLDTSMCPHTYYRDTLTVTINSIPSAGINDSVSYCSSGAAADLFTLLGGLPDTGGTWTPPMSSGTGIFDPATDAPGTYTYTIINSCGIDSADVVVTVHSVSSTTSVASICQGDSMFLEGSYQTTSGTYIDLFSFSICISCILNCILRYKLH